jgi:hypothetical protein
MEKQPAETPAMICLKKHRENRRFIDGGFLPVVLLGINQGDLIQSAAERRANKEE